MERSKVYFSDLRTRPGVNLLDKLERIMVAAGAETLDCRDKFVAVKLNFGEPGNMAYIRPRYVNRVVEGKPQLHVSLMMDISPECDCWGHNDAAIAPNVGFAVSTDPVALDQACADLVMAAPRFTHGNSLGDALEGKAGYAREAGIHHHPGEKDIFRIVHPDTDWQAGLAHAERIGLGSRSYELITL